MSSFTISGQLVDLHKRCIYPAQVNVVDGRIERITEVEDAPQQYILPGFIDAHVHIESSMLVPTAFARMAVTHGTIATVSDPHEIANVCGVEGVEYMIDNARRTPFKFFFGAPSCVPATVFETAGATLDAPAIEQLMASPDIWYLAELMNYPGVLAGDAGVVAKIAAAKKYGKPVDGHAPGLRGSAVRQYAAEGISTDHECTMLEEALEKIEAGMHILIREGSAAKNFDALHPLMATHPERVMFCSDDKHPNELALGHINLLVSNAVALGYNLFDVLFAACINPILHYSLPVGMLLTGDAADFIVVSDLTSFNILQTFIDGNLVAANGICQLPLLPAKAINNFHAQPRKPEDFRIEAMNGDAEVRIIEALDGQLITNTIFAKPLVSGSTIISDTSRDFLKIIVINRYDALALPAASLIYGFGLTRGAIASTVAHDCHNIIAVGVDDISICIAVNAVIQAKGGIAVADGENDIMLMPLPIAGIMTDADGYDAGKQYAALDSAAKALGSGLEAPFMTLSFMALLVIPALKLSDMGLFDGDNFMLTEFYK